jgi:hypothetical protein
MNSEDLATESARTRTTVTDGLDRLMQASADRVFAEPQRFGERVVIPAARIDLSGGVGLGLEHGQTTRAGRPVAVIEAGPEGVHVKPVIHLTRVGLTVLAAGFAVWTASRSPSRSPSRSRRRR